MAIVKCAECGREVSNMAKTCPSCEAPIPSAPTQHHEREYSVRPGSITGFIGAVSLPIILKILFMVGVARPSTNTSNSIYGTSIYVVPATNGVGSEGYSIVALLGLASLALATILFIIGFALANKLNRMGSLALSLTSLLTSLTVLISIFAILNVYFIFLGPIFGWEPILMTWGAVKMLKSSLKMPK